MKKRFWFFVHNAIAHPLLCINNRKGSWCGKFHNWTANKFGENDDKENLFADLLKSTFSMDVLTSPTLQKGKAQLWLHKDDYENFDKNIKIK